VDHRPRQTDLPQMWGGSDDARSHGLPRRASLLSRLCGFVVGAGRAETVARVTRLSAVDPSPLGIFEPAFRGEILQRLPERRK
jgi:hypothetical protein